MLIAVLTRCRHRYVSWASGMQSAPSHRTALRSVWALCSSLLLNLPSDLVCSRFTTKTSHEFILHECVLHACHVIQTVILLVWCSAKSRNFEVEIWLSSGFFTPCSQEEVDRRFRGAYCRWTRTGLRGTESQNAPVAVHTAVTSWHPACEVELHYAILFGVL
jgi:hypothetical protein